MATAKKKDPAKWARAKARARAKMGGHSARAMQLAVKYYKQAGGRYSGKKTSSNKLSKWSKQKWDYVSKGDKKKPKKKRGRYLPESVRKSLSPSQKSATNRAKRKASASGKRKAKYSKSVARKVRNA
jgi:type II secretory pathway pseudopilin PulG|tara:strand:+ start:432 stop:812 length:381 start_codon:yes stop_codon:yes gene_type:complete